MHVNYRATLRQKPPGGILRPAEATDLYPSKASCIRSALNAQGALVEVAMADLRELASPGSSSAATVLGSPEPDARDMAICNAIKNETPKEGLSVIEAVYGVFPVGQAIAVLGCEAWAPSGNHRPNRNTANAIEGKQLMTGRKFDPSATVREINKALQTAKRSRSALN